MTKKWLAVVTLAMMFVSAAAAQDAKTVVANAQKALGYSSLNTIVYSGPMSHEGAGLGQWMSPTKGWHQNTVRDFTRFIDYNAGTSQRTGLQNRPGAPNGMLPGGGGLDPSPNPPAPNTSNVAPTQANGQPTAWANRLEVTLSPPAFLKAAAAAPNVTAKSQSMNGKKYTVVSFPVAEKAPSGVPYTLTGYINQQNQVEKVVTAYEDAAPFIIGDVVVEQTYSDYKDFGGVQFPTRISQTRGGILWSDATIADVKPNAAAPAPPAPAAGGGGGRGGDGGGRGGAAGAPPAGGGRGGDAAAGGRGGGAGAPPAGGGRGGDAAAGGRGGAAGAPPAGGGQAAGGGRGGDVAAGGRGGAAAGAPPAGGGQAAAGGRGGAAAAPAGPRKLAEGVFAIGGGYQAMAIEFKDHIVMVEAPQNGIADLIAQAKQAIPNKPITHIIITHNHWDHAGGLRTVLAEGPKPVTLVTNAMSKAAFEKWFSNPRTLQATTPAPGAAPAAAAAAAPAAGGRGGGAPAPWPDALQASGKKVKFQYVKDKLVLKDSTQTVEIYPINGALHGEDMVVVYVPKAKAIFQSDAYNPGAAGAVTTGTGQLAFQKLLASELDRLKIDYETIVAGHTRNATKQDLMVAIGRVPPPAPAAPAPARGQ